MDHTRTQVKRPLTNGSCERFHRPVRKEFSRIGLRKKIYPRLAELQADLEMGLREYNEERPHHGRWCYGRTPMQTFRASIP
jgi:transposase InsO family protein